MANMDLPDLSQAFEQNEVGDQQANEALQRTEREQLDFEQKLDQFNLEDNKNAIGTATQIDGQQLAQVDEAIPKVSSEQLHEDELIALQQAEEDYWGEKKQEQERGSMQETSNRADVLKIEDDLQNQYEDPIIKMKSIEPAEPVAPEEDGLAQTATVDVKNDLAAPVGRYEFVPSSLRNSKPRSSATQEGQINKAIEEAQRGSWQHAAEPDRYSDQFLEPSPEQKPPAAPGEQPLLPKESPYKLLNADDLDAYEDKLSPDVRGSHKVDETTYSPDYTLP